MAEENKLEDQQINIVQTELKNKKKIKRVENMKKKNRISSNYGPITKSSNVRIIAGQEEWSWGKKGERQPTSWAKYWDDREKQWAESGPMELQLI